MPGRLLPLFPLQVVVFPRTRLPLHIFEDRYKEMVGDAIRNRTEFGIVLAKDEGIVNAGCTVVVEEVLKNYPDGRFDIITRGSRRFEIVTLDEDKAYLRGQVEYFDDENAEDVPDELRTRALDQFRALLDIGEGPAYGEPNLGDPQLSFQIAQSIQDLDFQSLLLRSRSESERLRDVTEFLSQYLPKQRRVVRMKNLAPTNGFGGKPANL